MTNRPRGAFLERGGVGPDTEKKGGGENRQARPSSAFFVQTSILKGRRGKGGDMERKRKRRGKDRYQGKQIERGTKEGKEWWGCTQTRKARKRRQGDECKCYNQPSRFAMHVSFSLYHAQKSTWANFFSGLLLLRLPIFDEGDVFVFSSYFVPPPSSSTKHNESSRRAKQVQGVRTWALIQRLFWGLCAYS